MKYLPRSRRILNPAQGLSHLLIQGPPLLSSLPYSLSVFWMHAKNWLLSVSTCRPTIARILPVHTWHDPCLLSTLISLPPLRGMKTKICKSRPFFIPKNKFFIPLQKHFIKNFTPLELFFIPSNTRGTGSTASHHKMPDLTMRAADPRSHEHCKRAKHSTNFETRVFLLVPPCLSNYMRPSAKKTSIAQIPLPTPPTLVPPSRKMRTRTRSWTSPGHD